MKLVTSLFEKIENKLFQNKLKRQIRILSKTTKPELHYWLDDPVMPNPFPDMCEDEIEELMSTCLTDEEKHQIESEIGQEFKRLKV